MSPIAGIPSQAQGLLKDWIVANLIALIALVQPWIYWTWKRYFRRGRIEVHETAKVEIGYSTFGPTIALLGTLRAVREDQFVRNIVVVLTRTRDDQRRKFTWLAFRPPTVVVGGPAQSVLEIASGFMLLTSQPWKYHIVFVDQQFQAEVALVLERVRSAWQDFWVAQGGLAAGADMQEVFQRFRAEMAHVNAYTELDRMLDWQPVEYRMLVSVSTANPDRTFSQTLSFRLTAQDVANLRSNCFRIIEEACGTLTLPYTFAYCDYVNRD